LRGQNRNIHSPADGITTFSLPWPWENNPADLLDDYAR
jgi:hypothetical protein